MTAIVTCTTHSRSQSLGPESAAQASHGNLEMQNSQIPPQQYWVRHRELSSELWFNILLSTTKKKKKKVQPKSWVVVVQSFSHVWRLVTTWIAVHQASLSTISWNLLKLMSIELMMPSNHLILYCPLLFLPSIFPSTRIFSNELALHIRWPKY